MTTYNEPEFALGAAIESACSAEYSDWHLWRESHKAGPRKSARVHLEAALPHLMTQIGDGIAQALEDEGRRREDSNRNTSATTGDPTEAWNQGFAAGVYYAVPIALKYGRKPS